MSGIASTTVYIDGLREREAVAGVLAGALRDVEARAARKGERVIWSTVSFNSDTDYMDEVSFRGTERNLIRRLIVAARTIDPSEVPGA